MTEEQWVRARSVFEALLECPEAERVQLAFDRCGDDEVLRGAVLELLAGDRAASGPLERGGELVAKALVEASERSWLGRRLGAYRIDGVLGRGGMGTVFEATRDDATFHKRVALKVMRSVFATQDARGRFERERQILATLEHVAIARLLDGGETDDGIPWLAMERIDGAPITTWCDDKRLGVRARVRLLAQVCDAVAYAHRQLVVHRDLKPANILVDAEGGVHLVDFGVAKLLDEAGAEGLTVRGQRFLTPGYASPEQVAGRVVATATDVYSLGVVLYELLVGAPPLRWDGLSPAVLQQRLEHQLPEAPSRAVKELAPEMLEARRASARQLTNTYRGDLDRIVLLALRPHDQERYSSVAALAEELRRWLDGRPVKAAGSGRLYRTRKFLKRHRVAVGAGVMVAAGLVAFAFAAEVQAQRAEAESRRAEAVTAMLIEAFAAADPERNRGEVITAREILDREAARLLRAPGPEPELAAELALAIARVSISLGLNEQARPLLDLAQRHGSDSARAKGGRALVEAELALAQGRGEVALGFAEQAAGLLRSAGRMDEAFAAERNIALAERALGRRAEAAERLERLLHQLEARPGGGSSDEALRARIELAIAEVDRGHTEAAIRVLRLGRNLTVPDSPLGVMLVSQLAEVLLRSGEIDEAGALGEEALVAARRIWGGRHPKVADLINLAGKVAWERGDGDGAQRSFLEALELRRELLGPRHPALARSLNNVALMFYRNLERPDLAEPLYREAVEIYEQAMGGVINPSLAVYLRGWGRALADAGQPQRAEAVLLRALDILHHHAAGHDTRVDVASTESSLAAVLASLGRTAEAKVLLERAYPVLVERYGVEHRITLRARDSLEGLEGLERGEAQ